uniref:Uncharacterized protein n=1 Tax=Tanacetum cinerariifolium TaxID=118510 RepID=A0A6L2KR60_TANCI|nr:hypothetical protein [Tanacetum cinerariifolium]
MKLVEHQDSIGGQLLTFPADLCINIWPAFLAVDVVCTGGVCNWVLVRKKGSEYGLSELAHLVLVVFFSFSLCGFNGLQK